MNPSCVNFEKSAFKIPFEAIYLNSYVNIMCIFNYKDNKCGVTTYQLLL